MAVMDIFVGFSFPIVALWCFEQQPPVSGGWSDFAVFSQTVSLMEVTWIFC